MQVTRLTANPGMRVGWNGSGGVRWVGGVAVPVGFTRHTDDLGVLFYLSIEHGFMAEARRARWRP